MNAFWRGETLYEVTRNTLCFSMIPLAICNQPGRLDFPERNCEPGEEPFPGVEIDPHQTALKAERDRLAL